LAIELLAFAAAIDAATVVIRAHHARHIAKAIAQGARGAAIARGSLLAQLLEFLPIRLQDSGPGGLMKAL
jgi:hypothetical protein